VKKLKNEQHESSAEDRQHLQPVPQQAQQPLSSTVIDSNVGLLKFHLNLYY